METLDEHHWSAFGVSISLDGIRNENDIEMIQCRVCSHVTLDLLKCPTCDGVWCNKCDSLQHSINPDGSKCLASRCPNIHTKPARLERHLAESGMIVCPGCEQKMEARQSLQHFKSGCKESIYCACGNVYKKLAFPTHKLLCPFVIVECDYCKLIMPRGGVEKHLHEDCTKIPLQCEDCYFTYRRSDMNAGQHRCLVTELKRDVYRMKRELEEYTQHKIYSEINKIRAPIITAGLGYSYNTLPASFDKFECEVEIQHIRDKGGFTCISPCVTNVWFSSTLHVVVLDLSKFNRIFVINCPEITPVVVLASDCRSVTIESKNGQSTNIFWASRGWTEKNSAEYPYIVPWECVLRQELKLTVPGKSISGVRSSVSKLYARLLKTLDVEPF